MLFYLIDPHVTQVLPAEIVSIRGNDIQFKNGKLHPFDSIVFCTGFKRSTNLWLKVRTILFWSHVLSPLSYFRMSKNMILFEKLINF